MADVILISIDWLVIADDLVMPKQIGNPHHFHSNNIIFDRRNIELDFTGACD